jgi:copper chaperone CopZ
MKIKSILLSSLLFALTSSFLLANEDKEEARQEVRLAAAKKALLESSEISLVYVKGLVCPSCAIGIRKNLSKLKGIDKKRFKDGIDMDPETQLVSIAFKGNFKIDNKDLIERVEDAGYIAVEEYKLHDGHLDAHQFKHDASVKVVHHTHK